jgi:hypothetical protein
VDVIEAGTLEEDGWFGMGWFAVLPHKYHKDGSVIPYNGR